VVAGGRRHAEAACGRTDPMGGGHGAIGGLRALGAPPRPCSLGDPDVDRSHWRGLTASHGRARRARGAVAGGKPWAMSVRWLHMIRTSPGEGGRLGHDTRERQAAPGSSGSAGAACRAASLASSRSPSAPPASRRQRRGCTRGASPGTRAMRFRRSPPPMGRWPTSGLHLPCNHTEGYAAATARPRAPSRAVAQSRSREWS